jgi:hypothetical protein
MPPQPVADRPEDRQRHSPLGDRQETIARTMQNREGGDGAGPEHSQDYRPDRMQQRGQTRRNQRMHHAQRPEFHQPRRNLSRSDQAAAAIAAVVLAPAISRRRGRCGLPPPEAKNSTGSAHREVPVSFSYWSR